jgi:hypothetical protein
MTPLRCPARTILGQPRLQRHVRPRVQIPRCAGRKARIGGDGTMATPET